MREGTIIENQKKKEETKGRVPSRDATRSKKKDNRQFNVISRTKTQNSPEIYTHIFTQYITYRQVPGYVNRYWNCIYKRRITHLAM